MSRIILNYVLPLVLPLAIYMTYMWWRRGRAVKQGDEVPAVEKTHVFAAIVAGFLLMAGSLTWIAVVSDERPGEGGYQSPVYKDGKIVPPSFK